jgi:hypothetical protein
MQQRNLVKCGDFGKEILMTLFWIQWTCWNQTGSLLGMSFSKLAMF